MLVGPVVGAHDCAVDDLVGEHLDAVEVAAVVRGCDLLDLHRTPVVAKDGEQVQGEGATRQFVRTGQERRSTSASRLVMP